MRVPVALLHKHSPIAATNRQTLGGGKRPGDVLECRKNETQLRVGVRGASAGESLFGRCGRRDERERAWVAPYAQQELRIPAGARRPRAPDASRRAASCDEPFFFFFQFKSEKWVTGVGLFA